MKRIGALMLGLALLAGTAHATVTFETIFDGGFPLGVTPDGQTVAGNTTGYGPFRWTQAGGLVPLGMVPTPSPGGTPGISADGNRVASTILGSDSTYSAAGLWTLGSGWTELPFPADGIIRDGGSTTAYALSADGSTVVGLYWRAVGRGHAFRWTQAGGSIDLGSANPSSASRADVVNADGSVIAGWDEAITGRWRAAAWVNGFESLLGDSSGDSQVHGINPAGTIAVGFSRNTANDTRECARWTRTGSTWSATQQLGSVAGTYPSYGINQARGVTASGDMIVGYCSFDGSPYWNTGFVWTQATGCIDVVSWLGSKGVAVDANFYIQDCTAITPDGQWIFGYGQDLVPPYTRRAYRIHNTDVAAVPAPDARSGLALASPAPNPTSGASRLSFDLPETGDVDLSIFDVSGRRVATVLHASLPSGPHASVWNGRDDQGRGVGAGLYWVKLATRAGSVTQRLVRIR